MPHEPELGSTLQLTILVHQICEFLLGMLLTLVACNNHKRPNSFGAKPDENVSPPYNGVPQGGQKK
jgi:hypothetical protein